MSDAKSPSEKQRDEKQPGTFHYNPGNMSGKEAGSSKEHDKQKGKDDADCDLDDSREDTKQGGKG
jgi:hypothetical protein